MIDKDLEKALEIVTERTGVTRKEILSKGRVARIAIARQVVCWLMRNRGWDYTSIGKLMGMYHGTVIHACRKVNLSFEVDKSFKRVWPELLGNQIAFGNSETRKENKRKLEEMVEA